MKENHSLALIAAYYLSKFDAAGYQALGFTNKTTAHKEIGKLLGVNPNSIKNMRDEFDPLHENARAGWYQRPLRPSRAKVVESLQNLSEIELRDLVLEILTNPNFESSDDYADIINSISSRDIEKKGKQVFIVRGPTGKKAEDFFIKQHQESSIPISGELLDTRDDGCGYDFEIRDRGTSYQVEVKGLDGDSGGILLTSKEWEVARERKNSYFLVIVRNISESPKIQIIRNPAAVLRPKKNIHTVVQVNWTVPEKDLRL